VIIGVLVGLGGASGIMEWWHRYRIHKFQLNALRELLLDEKWDWRSEEVLKNHLGVTETQQ
jgi:hypothetical protein